MMGLGINTVIISVLELIAGAGVFITACEMMSNGMQALLNKRGFLPSVHSKPFISKLAGLGIGTLATAAVQSSSAVSVMLIGLADAGAIGLSQAATVIFGANIGTTLTGQLVALGVSGGNSVSPAVVFSAFAGLGAAIKAVSKTEKAKRVGGILCGFGMIFVGLTLMSDSADVFSESEAVKGILSAFRNPLMLVLIGAIITACIQSSSVMTTLAITSVASGLITLEQGVYISIGANIGTTATALIAALSCGTNAKRIALLHVFFNTGGAVIFLVIGGILALCGSDYSSVLTAISASPHVALAVFHTFFNVATAMIALPLTDVLVRITTKLVTGKNAAQRV